MVLAAFPGATATEEIVAATQLTRPQVDSALRKLEKEEVVSSTRQGRSRLHHIADPGVREKFLRGLRPREIAAFHNRAAEHPGKGMMGSM